MFGQRVKIEVLAPEFHGGLAAAGRACGFSRVASGFPARSCRDAAGTFEAARSIRSAPGGG